MLISCLLCGLWLTISTDSKNSNKIIDFLSIRDSFLVSRDAAYLTNNYGDSVAHLRYFSREARRISNENDS